MRNGQIVALVATAALAATLGLTGCSRSQAPSSNTAAPTPTTAPAGNASAPTTQKSYIGEDAAKAAALEHAGLSQADVTELKAELDTDDAVVHYEVDFKSGGKEYDYDIDATTGDVLNSSSETDD